MWTLSIEVNQHANHCKNLKHVEKVRIIQNGILFKKFLGKFWQFLTEKQTNQINLSNFAI